MVDDSRSGEEKQHRFGGPPEEVVVKATVETIGQYFVRRLEWVLAGVAEPRVLSNSRNCPLFLLCFAVGNPAAVDLALRMANSKLGKGRL